MVVSIFWKSVAISVIGTCTNILQLLLPLLLSLPSFSIPVILFLFFCFIFIFFFFFFLFSLFFFLSPYAYSLSSSSSCLLSLSIRLSPFTAFRPSVVRVLSVIRLLSAHWLFLATVHRPVRLLSGHRFLSAATASVDAVWPLRPLF